MSGPYNSGFRPGARANSNSDPYPTYGSQQRQYSSLNPNPNVFLREMKSRDTKTSPHSAPPLPSSSSPGAGYTTTSSLPRSEIKVEDTPSSSVAVGSSMQRFIEEIRQLQAAKNEISRERERLQKEREEQQKKQQIMEELRFKQVEEAKRRAEQELKLKQDQERRAKEEERLKLAKAASERKARELRLEAERRRRLQMERDQARRAQELERRKQEEDRRRKVEFEEYQRRERDRLREPENDRQPRALNSLQRLKLKQELRRGSQKLSSPPTCRLLPTVSRKAEIQREGPSPRRVVSMPRSSSPHIRMVTMTLSPPRTDARLFDRDLGPPRPPSPLHQQPYPEPLHRAALKSWRPEHRLSQREQVGEEIPRSQSPRSGSHRRVTMEQGEHLLQRRHRGGRLTRMRIVDRVANFLQNTLKAVVDSTGARSGPVVTAFELRKRLRLNLTVQYLEECLMFEKYNPGQVIRSGDGYCFNLAYGTSNETSLKRPCENTSENPRKSSSSNASPPSPKRKRIEESEKSTPSASASASASTAASTGVRTAKTTNAATSATCPRRERDLVEEEMVSKEVIARKEKEKKAQAAEKQQASPSQTAASAGKQKGNLSALEKEIASKKARIAELTKGRTRLREAEEAELAQLREELQQAEAKKKKPQ